MQDARNWTIEETQSADFGDERLNKRYGSILSNFGNAPSQSIPATFKSWGETIAAYRFFNHDNVSHSKILTPHRESTLERIKNERIVLIPQDTTEIDFSTRKPIAGMGYLGDESSQGFYLHPCLAVTPERTCLGVIDMQLWTRETLGKSEERKSKPLEEKESYCWLKGYEAANQVALSAPDTVIVSIADRGGDIYELLEKMPSEKNKAYWLVRSQHNRALNSGDKELGPRLWETVRNSKALGEVEFKMPAGKIYNRNKSKRQPREERTVRQEIRSRTVLIRPPRRKEKTLEPIAVNLVHCCEINAPNNEEKIEWFLLTSFPIDSAESALKIVEWYLCRWQIEIFFKILKSGCCVEELQFDTLKATANCIALYMIVAWRILYLTMLGRNCPDIDCSAVFEVNEWQSVYAIVTKKTPPKTAPKLNEIILMIAKLGGFLGRKSDGYPGSKVMWIGMQRMKDFTLAWETFRSMGDETYV